MRIFHFYLFLAYFLLCGTASAAAVEKNNERFFPNFFLRRNKLTANVVGPDIDATVSFSQGNGDTTAGTWIVKINSFDVAGFSETDCPNGLKWHIHALPVDENDTDLLGRCSFDNIGNHFDPTYGKQVAARTTESRRTNKISQAKIATASLLTLIIFFC